MGRRILLGRLGCRCSITGVQQDTTAHDNCSYLSRGTVLVCLDGKLPTKSIIDMAAAAYGSVVMLE